MQQHTTPTNLISPGLLVKTVQELSLARDIAAAMHMVRSVARLLPSFPSIAIYKTHRAYSLTCSPTIKTMENKKGINFFFAVIVLILGVVTYKQFDFERWEFEKPALAFVYLATLVLSIYFLIRNYRKQPGK